MNGRDVADAAFTIHLNESVTPLTITLTDRTTELSGTVRDGKRPVAGAYVVVFPTDRTLRILGSRRLPLPIRSATDGTFHLSGLPPGTYHVAAVTGIEPSKMSDDAFLAGLRATAATVTLAYGEKTASVDVPLSRR